MIRAAILFAVLFSYVSCAYLDDIFKVSIMKAIRAAEMNLTNTGKVENCAGSTDIKWAAPGENVPSGICEQQRPRSACASAQSDQNPY